VSGLFATARTLFERALTAFVILQLAALAVLILVGVLLRKLGVPFVSS
jgi:hypothetical protein